MVAQCVTEMLRDLSCGGRRRATAGRHMQPVRGTLPSAEGNPARHCRASAATREQAGWGSQGGSVSPPRLPVQRPLSPAALGPSAFAEVVRSSDAIDRKSEEDWLNGLVVFPTFFILSMNLAIWSSWSEPQSAPGLVFADCIELLHLWLQRIRRGA